MSWEAAFQSGITDLPTFIRQQNDSWTWVEALTLETAPGERKRGPNLRLFQYVALAVLT